MALNINGTTGISGVDGSASAASIAGTDANTGLSFASDTVNINTGGSTRATINSSGKFGINTASPVGKLTVDENNASEHFQLRNTTNTSNFSAFGVDTSFNLRMYVNGSNERMRIDSDGRLLIGLTSLSASNGSSDGICLHAPNGERNFSRGSTSNGDQLAFYNPNGLCGRIQTSGSSTSYVTSSDYRLKENATTIADGITRLKTLKPYRFNFKADATTILDGFFAHEVTAVPEAITGTKDAVDENNKPIYQGIDQSKLVPLLTAALQEAVAKIEVLETKVAALEAG